jgi:hypothetical protein
MTVFGCETVYVSAPGPANWCLVSMPACNTVLHYLKRGVFPLDPSVLKGESGANTQAHTPGRIPTCPFQI